MNSNEDYLARYTSKVGFTREKITSKITPDIRKINIFVIFGELSQTVFFANTIYPNLVSNKDAVNIVLSWPGLRCFFNSADEFWSPNQSMNIAEFYSKCDGIQNNSVFYNVLLRNLNETFFNIKTATDYIQYFKDYITNDFIKKFPKIEFNFPNLLSRAYVPNFLGSKLLTMPDKKIVIIPWKYTVLHQYGKVQIIPHQQTATIGLAKNLLRRNYGVVCIQNDFTFDLSKELEHDNLAYIQEYDFQKIMTICNLIGNYLDYFGNSMFIGAQSQANTLSIGDRSFWFNCKKNQEFIVYDNKKKNKNFFSFLNFNTFADDELNDSYFSNIIRCLDELYVKNNLDKEQDVIKQKYVDLDQCVKIASKSFYGKFIKLKGLNHEKV